MYHQLLLISPPLSDICDGNMRAIYSLFYNLSHFKKMAKEGHGEGGGGAPSRIARPISPGLKSTLSVSSGGGSSGIPTSSKLASPSSSSSLSNGPAAVGGGGGTAAAAARKGAGERERTMMSCIMCLSGCMMCVCSMYVCVCV